MRERDGRLLAAVRRARSRSALETIYEGYLCHYGRPRLFAPPDDERALLLGDYLYAHGLVRIAATGSVDAVAELAELISALLAAPCRGRERRRRGVARRRRRRSGPEPPDDARRRAARSPRTGRASAARVAPVLAFISGSLAEDAATEGKKVITAMLIVGLVFLSVIALGETSRALRRRRVARRGRGY